MDIQRRGQPQIGQPEFDQAGALTARGGGAAAGAAAGSTQGQQIQQMDEERRRRTTAPEVRSDLLDWIMQNIA
jgi:hypothetical protein